MRAGCDHSGTSTSFPNFCIDESGSGIDLIAPSMDHRVAVEVVNKLDDALFQFVFRGDADVTKDGARSFSKEALDQIEPGAVLGREHELEAFVRSGRQPSLGFFG